MYDCEYTNSKSGKESVLLSFWRVQRSTCAILHTKCTYLPTGVWLGNHYYSHLCMDVQHFKRGTVVTLLDAVTMTVELVLVFMVSLTSVLFKPCLHTPIQSRTLFLYLTGVRSNKCSYHTLGMKFPLTWNVVRPSVSLLTAERRISSTWHDCALLSSADIINETRSSTKVAFSK